MITGTDACTQRIDQMTDEPKDPTEGVALPTEDGDALSPMAVDGSLPADPVTKATAPDQADPSRPIRAKRPLAVVAGTDTAKGQTASPRSAPDPETGLTQKQEAFVQGIVDGKSLSDSYRDAYDVSGMTAKTVHEEACRLVANPKITARLQQINREKEEARRMLMVTDAAAAVETFRLMMAKADTDASKIRAAELLAKAAGVFTEKVEFEDKTDRTVSDLEQAIKDRLARLGLTG